MDFVEMSGKEIKAYIAQLNEQELKKALEILSIDKRSSIQTIVTSGYRQIEKKEKESQRIQMMWQYELQHKQQGYQWIAGVDEVGRGPLAGPVVAAAVILPDRIELPNVNDSKKLTHAQRETLSDLICAQAIAYHIAEIDAESIDKKNILQASREAMQIAVSGLSCEPDFVLVDGLENPLITKPNQAIVQGDSKSISIAAASIIAKVYRDRLMDAWDQIYPMYGLKQHKGYPTASHIAAIEEYGPCPIHRMSFQPLKRMLFQKQDK